MGEGGGGGGVGWGGGGGGGVGQLSLTFKVKHALKFQFLGFTLLELHNHNIATREP